MGLNMTAALFVVYALITAVFPTAEAGLWSKDVQEPTFAVVPPRLSSKGRGTLTELQQLANGETFVNKLLGTDCFSKSLSIVNKDCSKLDSEKKSRLAMALAICQLDQLGLPTFSCKPSMSLKQCADNMHNDRQYTTYMEFLSNIDTTCLFLQSQDFQRHTEFMINSLYSSSQHAAEQLNEVDTHLTQSLSTMDKMAGKLSNVETAQEQQLQLSHENLKGVQQLHEDSQQVHAQLANALQNEELMLLKQSQVLTNLASLDEEEAARAESAGLRWQEAQDQAAHLLQQQHQYQQVQQQLLGDLRQLSDNSAGLRTALDVVVQYEQRGAVMLTHMLGSTYSVQDLLAYALAAVCIAATGLSKSLRAARLPLIGLFALSVVAERAVMHSFHHMLEIEPTGEVMMAMPFVGATLNPKTAIRRVCFATAVAMIMWGVWKNTDNEQETLRLCRRIEAQQQLQQKQQEELVHAHKQQYIEFMTEMRQQKSGPDPKSLQQDHTCCANGECPLPLSWMDGDAHGYHQQLPQQVQQEGPQLREAQLYRSQTLCEAMTPAVQTPSTLGHGLHARRQSSSSEVQHEHSPGSDKVHQDYSAKLCMHEQQTKREERVQQHGHHDLDASKHPASNSVRQAEQCSATAQKTKKRCASQTDEEEAEKAAGSMQTVSEATIDGGCKASKRQRPDKKAKASYKS